MLPDAGRHRLILANPALDNQDRHHHNGFHSFVGFEVFGPWPWYYRYYPYYLSPYDYPYVYPSPIVVGPEPPAVASEPIQREVVYPTGKYVLHGDGINYPWGWVWIPAPPPAPPTPRAP